MAKRYTDTTKWGNPAFRKLPTKYKLLYLFMLDSCDCAGVMHLDFQLISVQLGEEYNADEFKQVLGERVVFLNDNCDKIIIKNLIAFLYGDMNSSTSSMARTVKSYLSNHGLLERYLTGEFGNVNKTIQLWT